MGLDRGPLAVDLSVRDVIQLSLSLVQDCPDAVKDCANVVRQVLLDAIHGLRRLPQRLPLLGHLLLLRADAGHRVVQDGCVLGQRLVYVDHHVTFALLVVDHRAVAAHGLNAGLAEEVQGLQLVLGAVLHISAPGLLHEGEKL